MHSHVSENRKSKFGKFTSSVLRAFRLMRWDTATDTATAHKTKVSGLLTSVSAFADLSCPSWARAEGGQLRPTRTLLIQGGRRNQPNSSNLQPSKRVRVTRC